MEEKIFNFYKYPIYVSRIQIRIVFLDFLINYYNNNICISNYRRIKLLFLQITTKLEKTTDKENS
jgi:hypothetical protein